MINERVQGCIADTLTSILEKDTLERTDRLFSCDEVHQREPTGILEQRNIRMIAKGHI